MNSEETPQKHPSVCVLIFKGESGAAASLNSEEASKRALGSEDLEAYGWYLSGESLGSTGPHYTVDPKCSLHEDLLGQPGQRTHPTSSDTRVSVKTDRPGSPSSNI